MSCHSGGEDAEAGFDVEQLGKVTEEDGWRSWVAIYDRVASGEMPPPEDADLASNSRSEFLAELEERIYNSQIKHQRAVGRVVGRRLTNLQLEKTLHDLLGIDIPLEREMPEEPRSEDYLTLASKQTISHFHLEQHVKVVDMALDEAFRRALTPADETVWQFSAKEISRTRTRTREPEFIDGSAVVWASNLVFYGRLPATTARESGWYEFEFEVSSLKQPQDRGIWCSVRSGQCVSSAPLMAWVGAFEATDEAKRVTVQAWLPKGHMLEVRPADQTLKKARFQGGQSANGEGGKQNVPGIAIHGLTMKRIHLQQDDTWIRNRLFGSDNAYFMGDALEVKKPKSGADDSASFNAYRQERIKRFAELAFRRPVQTGEIEKFVDLFDARVEADASLADALKTTYRAILCSLRFLYFEESPGELDPFSIASRLSYFLWNSMPDAVLFEKARNGALRSEEELLNQVERMLESGRGNEFVTDFAAEWLELNQIGFTTPDRKQFPTFDIVVRDSMLQETHRFLQNCLDQDLPVSQLIHADFTYMNSRLARFYGLDLSDELDDQMRFVSLEPKEQTRRGGLLAQGAVLKVTANGTNTSPVVRGVWVARRIMGVEIPPPPDNVPAIEPDIRGAKTIREQLSKHRSVSECSVCHVKIDPYGFGLENFDPSGQWRDEYSGRRGARRQAVDMADQLPDGQAYEDFDEFRRLLASKSDDIARNLAKQWLVYGTGAEISFADRRVVDEIVDQVAKEGLGVKTILRSVVASPIFLMK